MEDRPSDIPALLAELDEMKLGVESKENASVNKRGEFVSAEDTGESVVYGSALPALYHSAELRHADAQYCLGRCYYDGNGVSRDHTQATQWFRKAAEQGHADAQHWLGLLYYRGHGAPMDHTQASQWFRKAAAQGLHYAQECLGLMHFRGEGMPKDHEQAAHWLRKAAEQEHPEILFDHHIWYQSKGEGALEVFTEAVQWFQMAAEEGLADAQLCLGVMYLRGQGLRQDYAEAFRWFQAAARQGLASAQHFVGRMCLIGFGEPEHCARNLHWFREASARGYSSARLNLGGIRENCEGVPEDEEQTIEWFRNAAEQGLVDAQYYMGLIHYQGEHVPQDHEQASLWFRRAAQWEFADAQYCLGLMLYRGEYVPDKDSFSEDGVTSIQLLERAAEQKLLAARWFQKAAERGLANAQYYLGLMHYRGQGVTKDGARAIQWFQRAADQEHSGARHYLRRLGLTPTKVWVPTGVPHAQQRTLALPGKRPQSSVELLGRLRERVEGLIDESKWLGEFHLAERQMFKNSYFVSAYEALRDCLTNPEVIEEDRAVLWTMADLALREGNVSDEEVLASWKEEVDSQTLIEWLTDLDEAMMLMEPGLL